MFDPLNIVNYVLEKATNSFCNVTSLCELQVSLTYFIFFSSYLTEFHLIHPCFTSMPVSLNGKMPFDFVDL